MGNLKFQMRFASHNALSNLVPRAFPLNGWEKPWGRGCALSFYDIPELNNNMHFLQASSPGVSGTPKELVLRLFLRLHIFQVSQPPAPLTTRLINSLKFTVPGAVTVQY